jgi:hypothetical protein
MSTLAQSLATLRTLPHGALVDHLMHVIAAQLIKGE